MKQPPRGMMVRTYPDQYIVVLAMCKCKSTREVIARPNLISILWWELLMLLSSFVKLSTKGWQPGLLVIETSI